MTGHRRSKTGNVHGIVLLDKPVGMTSNAALQQVKRLFRAGKAGHTGSLDPLAGGLLPVCLGEATKVSGFLLDANKRYRTVVTLGVRTTTGDAEGEALQTRPVPELDRARIEAVLTRFRGEIEQIPPMFSAIKYKGKPLYKLARRGESVERKPRTVTIHELKLMDYAGDRLDLDIFCSKGTYIRTLAEDIGEVLGCGAHVSALRRTALGPYDEGAMVTLEQLEALAAQGPEQLDSVLLPIESALVGWPAVTLSDDAAYYLRMGQPVVVPHAPTRGWVRLFAGKGGFLGLGQILDDGRVAPRRLVHVA